MRSVRYIMLSPLILNQFQLTRSMRSVPLCCLPVLQYDNFNSHAPCGACGITPPDAFNPYHFNSHAPCGACPLCCLPVLQYDIFQLTRSMRSVQGTAIIGMIHRHFNSHAPCGACHIAVLVPSEMRISTHTLHAERAFICCRAILAE